LLVKLRSPITLSSSLCSLLTGSNS
jgi:hypothetical protein